MPFASCKVQALEGVLARAELLEKGNLPLLYARVLRVAQAA